MRVDFILITGIGGAAESTFDGASAVFRKECVPLFIGNMAFQCLTKTLSQSDRHINLSIRRALKDDGQAGSLA